MYRLIGIVAFCCALVGALKNPTELAAECGYRSEKHAVVTADGYELNVFRVRNETAASRSSKAKPVLLMPGLFCNAAIWVLLGPGKALTYLLADQGYDVWLGSYRGNMYARKHLNLSDSDAAFWNFSWHEHGKYDALALIDHVLQESGESTVRYIGHSMGCTALMVLASLQPAYARKVSAVYMLAPAGYMAHANAPLYTGATEIVPFLQTGLMLFGSGEIPLHSSLVRNTLKGLCWEKNPIPICAFLESFLTGGDSKLINQADADYYLEYIPDSPSVKELAHFVQQMHKGNNTFRQYDYGELNQKVYGQPEPPSYNLSRSSMPISVYYSDGDILANRQDVLNLAGDLPNLARQPYRIPYTMFSHLDFFFATTIKELLYDQLLLDMQEDDRKNLA